MDVNVVASTISRLEQDFAATLPPVAVPGSQYDGREFRNPIFLVSRSSVNSVNIQATGDYSDFQQLQKSRSSSANHRPLDQVLSDLCTPGGIPVSNVGVSVALTTIINHERFALMQYRPNTGALGLLSGYVDGARDNENGTSGAGRVVSQGLEEVRDELIAAFKPGLVAPGRARGALIRQLLKEVVFASGERFSSADGLTIDLGHSPVDLAAQSAKPEQLWSLRSISSTAYVYNANPHATVRINDTVVPQASFQYVPGWNAAQMIFSFELTLPRQRDGLFLFHAEDGQIGGGSAPWNLETKLYADNLVLVKLDRFGFLTDRTYHLRDGQLVLRADFNRENIKLSEAFGAPAENSWNNAGITGNQPVSFADYRAAVDHSGTKF